MRDDASDETRDVQSDPTPQHKGSGRWTPERLARRRAIRRREKLDPVDPTLASIKLKNLAHARWAFDAARDPDEHAYVADSDLGAVTHIDGVLTLHHRNGDVLTRYVVRPGSMDALKTSESLAYLALDEL